jgi:formate dehydrogenase major subunit
MKKIYININGFEIETTSDKTILEAIHDSNLDKIPTLCYDKRLEHITSCFLCVVEIEGINKLIPACSTFVNIGMKIWTNSEKVRLSRKTALELLLSNHYADCIGPCTNNCPSNVDVQSYIALTSIGKNQEALKLIKENNPLPLSIGRVCVRNCEEACRRNLIDEPVAINCLKRYLADEDSLNKWTPERKSKKNKRIAVIGSGPAGLTCSYYLAIEGYDVKIFEKQAELGGMLKYGIPEFRLPKEILDSEIKWILDSGNIQVQNDIELGIDFSIEDLKNQGYNAVFVGVGAHKASKLGLDGEEIIKGIYKGIDFLREITNNKNNEILRGLVLVVGGGNTAIDAARTALRCGADSVRIVYRRSIKEMPANHEEIEAAQKEGIEILFLTNPKSLIIENNIIKGLVCIKMKLEEATPGQRPRPVPISGSEFTIMCDAIISAIGQTIDTTFVKKDSCLNLNKWDNIVINNDTYETSIPGVFAGGDSVTGPLTAIAAIAQGKKASWSIMNYLEKNYKKKPQNKFFSFKHKLTPLIEREFENCKKIDREKSIEIPINERKNNFNEVDLGLNAVQSQHETERCLECGCSEYADCSLRQYCDEYNINISKFIGETKKYSVDDRHPFIIFNPNKCINCGKCVRTCSEILKVSALGFVYRGFKSIVKPSMEKALSETNCIDCGNCIDVCPTGAISEKFPHKILGTLAKENIETICNFCSLGCKINFKKISNDIFYISNSTENIKDSQNKGFLCTKGRFGHRYLSQKNRVLQPVIKEKGIALNVSEEEVIEQISKKIKQVIKDYGNDSVAIMASPKLTNEELFLLQKFTRVGLGNNNISNFSNMLYSFDDVELDYSLGFTSSTTTTNALENADVIIVINSNLTEDNLIMELKIKSAVKKGAKLILINSSETELAKYSDLWIDSKKGTNTLFLNGIMKDLIDKSLINHEFIENKTDYYANFKLKIEEFNKDDIIRISEIHNEKFDKFVELILKSDSNIIFVYNIDSTMDKSIHELKAISNFLLLTGRIEKSNNGLILIRAFNNSAGSIDMGAIPNYLPGFVKYNEKDEIDRIGKLWKIDLSNVFRPIDLNRKLKLGEIRALLVFGEDPLIIDNNRKYMNNLEFLVVSDSFKTNIMKEADAILPSSTFIEQEGTYTNSDNVIQKVNKVVQFKLKYSNWEIISKLASNFSNQFNYSSIDEIFEEIKKINRIYKHSEIGKSFCNLLFVNDLSPKKYKFSEYEVDLSTFDPFKPVIHYQENYYICNIKMQLM